MSKFITRVQLKQAAQSDYERLDIEMQKGLFVRADKASGTGVREYNYQGLTTIREVITAAYVAASRVGKQYSLTVMKEKRLIPA